MEEKRLKQFTFYDLYYDALKRLPDEAAGRNGGKYLQIYVYKRKYPGAAGRQRKLFLEQHQGRSRRG